MISRKDIERFVRTYIGNIEELSSNIDKGYRILLFPTYLATPQTIACTISSASGVAIEFREPAAEWKIDVRFDSRPIGDAVFPTLSSQGSPFLVNQGVNVTVQSINFITREFYDQYKDIIDALSRATNFVKDDLDTFFKIEAGDIRLVDVGTAYIEGDARVARRIPCLWLFASNSEREFVEERARQLARDHYLGIVRGASKTASIQGLMGTLKEYKKLLERANLLEEEMQKFLSENVLLLDPSTKAKWTKGDLRKLKMPEADFLIKTSDQKFIVVELESPGDRLLTAEAPPSPSKELRKAESQIISYMSEIRNGILNYRDRFDPAIRVENVSGLIVIGRSSSLTSQQRADFEKYVSTVEYSIITYDELHNRAETFLDNIGIRYGAFM